jgi:hypothetical protein
MSRTQVTSRKVIRNGDQNLLLNLYHPINRCGRRRYEENLHQSVVHRDKAEEEVKISAAEDHKKQHLSLQRYATAALLRSHSKHEH